MYETVPCIVRHFRLDTYDILFLSLNQGNFWWIKTPPNIYIRRILFFIVVSGFQNYHFHIGLYEVKLKKWFLE